MLKAARRLSKPLAALPNRFCFGLAELRIVKSRLILMRGSAPRSDRVLALAAVRVDPNDVLELLQTVRTSPTPTAISYSSHRRMNLIVHSRRVDVDDASQNLRRQLKRAISVACKDG